jgi:hypothetical protein
MQDDEQPDQPAQGEQLRLDQVAGDDPGDPGDEPDETAGSSARERRAVDPDEVDVDEDEGELGTEAGEAEVVAEDPFAGDEDRFSEDELGTSAEPTPGAGRTTTTTQGEDARTVRPGGGDRGGVPGRDDLEGDIGADVSGATGPLSEDAGFDEDVPGARPEPAEPDPHSERNLP